MARIEQLPEEVVAKIAAGEVIERPSSVVKELLENSIDAGATRIDIELDAAGTERILIIDDGSGIAAEDLPKAFSRHATSKLQSAEDLFHIGTLGFRGEALASIAGVAQVSMQSRTHDSNSGAELRCAGSQLGEVKSWGGAPGTRIEVRNLFYNIPVRKKFLKSIATELGHVTETVTKLSLANPHLHFTLKHNGKLVYEVPGSANLLDRIGLFFGAEVQNALYPIDAGPGAYTLTGYIADPKCDKGSAKFQYFFINGRWFRDRSVGHALQEAYRGLLMSGRYAVGFLFIGVPPEEVDVNVHPCKAEVRFRENSQIFSLVRSTVKTRLMQEDLLPNLQIPNRMDNLAEPNWQLSPPPPPKPNLFSPRRENAEQSESPWDKIPTKMIAPPEADSQTVDNNEASDEPSFNTESTENTEEIVEELPFEMPNLPHGAALQVHDAYIVLEVPEGMLVIDQHALHERILYEQLRQRIRVGKLEIQRLLIPEPIELPAEQLAAVIEVQDQLGNLGLQVSEFGGNTILLSSYPTLLSRRSPHEILQAVIDYLVTKERAPSKEVMLDHLLATMACKAAVKAGDKLTADEMEYLLQLRDMAEDSHHCPHGRPTSLVFSRQQLDKQFGRI